MAAPSACFIEFRYYLDHESPRDHRFPISEELHQNIIANAVKEPGTLSFEFKINREVLFLLELYSELILSSSNQFQFIGVSLSSEIDRMGPLKKDTLVYVRVSEASSRIS